MRPGGDDAWTWCSSTASTTRERDHDLGWAAGCRPAAGCSCTTVLGSVGVTLALLLRVFPRGGSGPSAGSELAVFERAARRWRTASGAAQLPWFVRNLGSRCSCGSVAARRGLVRAPRRARIRTDGARSPSCDRPARVARAVTSTPTPAARICAAGSARRGVAVMDLNVLRLHHRRGAGCSGPSRTAPSRRCWPALVVSGLPRPPGHSRPAMRPRPGDMPVDGAQIRRTLFCSLGLADAVCC